MTSPLDVVEMLMSRLIDTRYAWSQPTEAGSDNRSKRAMLILVGFVVVVFALTTVIIVCGQ